MTTQIELQHSLISQILKIQDVDYLLLLKEQLTAPNINTSKNNNPPKTYSVNEIRKSFPNAYRKWTSKEEELLLKWYDAGATIHDIAKELKRQPAAIYSRLKKIR
ncbi:MAG: hypothetical protein AB8G22_21090 [Saprospiraceae bacterium]